MTYDEVVEHFGGTAYKVAKACRFGMGTPYGWKKQGFIPIETQRKLEKLTDGALKASLLHCERVDANTD